MNNAQQPYEIKTINPFQNTETAALAYAAAGLSVLPLELPKKNPCGIGSWKQLQQNIASADEIKSWFNHKTPEIGIICGNVSGNVEVIDFDEKYNIDDESLFKRFKTIINEIAPGLIDKLVIETTVSHGYHLIYKCDTIEGNQKLALRPPTPAEIQESKKNERYVGPLTLIETRGEGGYFMCVPSKGYELMQGSLEHIQTISKEERAILLNCTRGFNQVVEKHNIIDAPAHLDAFVKRPGDDFNIRGDIRGLLRENQWRMVGKHDRGEYWCRPGKSQGISASLLCGRKYPIPYFYVFSTNAHPFQENKHHTFFSVYTSLKHAGDWAEAAKALAKEGFGSTVISEAEEYLTARYEFRLNLITNRTEYRKIGTKGYVEIGDVHLNSLFRELQRFHIKIGVDVLAGLLHSDYVPTYDPFVEYYSSLPAWDGKTDHIEQLARTITLTNPADFAGFKDHLTKWLVNAVGCAVIPEITNHNALILVGPQGRYKTTWLNRLVPSQLERYKFIGTINPDNKDTLIHLSECFLVNLDELETLKRSDIGSLKSVMTLQHIHVRRPYGRIAENLIRRASFVGSINRREFLNDETGTRRFLTHEIETIDLQSPVDIDGVHAQAYHLYKQGYKYWFDTSGVDAVNKHNAQFGIRTTEDELIENMFTPVTEYEVSSNDCKWKTPTDIALTAHTRFNYPVNPNSSKCFGIALKKAGYISKRANAGTRYAVRELTGMELAERDKSNQAPPPHVPSPEELVAGREPELPLGV